jgi:hypothetical protein
MARGGATDLRRVSSAASARGGQPTLAQSDHHPNTIRRVNQPINLPHTYTHTVVHVPSHHMAPSAASRVQLRYPPPLSPQSVGWNGLPTPTRWFLLLPAPYPHHLLACILVMAGNPPRIWRSPWGMAPSHVGRRPNQLPLHLHRQARASNSRVTELDPQPSWLGRLGQGAHNHGLGETIRASSLAASLGRPPGCWQSKQDLQIAKTSHVG